MKKSPDHEIRKKEDFLEEKQKAYKILETLSSYEEKETIWHIVSTKWYKQWKIYMETESEEKNAGSSNPEPLPSALPAESRNLIKNEYPGPIFNDDIILFESLIFDPEDVNGFTKYPLKPGLKEGIDFILVPTELWNLWSNIYGGLNLPRKSYTLPDSMKPTIEVYLQRIPIVFRPFYKFTPSSVQFLHISRRDPATQIQVKVKRICEKWIKEKNSTSSLKDVAIYIWKISLHDIDEIDELIKRKSSYEKKQVGIDGTLIDLNKSVEELALGETTVLIFDIEASGNESIFKEKKVTRPRLDAELEETDNIDWKKYCVVEEMKFTKIPMKIIANPTSTRCGRTGLENLGNTCYMNSGLQCLSNCQELTKYFLLGLYKDEINKVNPLGQKGYLACAFADLLNEIWKGNFRAVSAYELKKRIVVNAGQFKGYAQQDSQELILYMLDGLHEDLNRVKSKPYIELKDYKGIADEELSKKRWEEHLMRNRSIIVDLFCGQLKSRLICPQCRQPSVAFDPFMVLSVPIPQLIYLKVTYVPLNMTSDNLSIKIPATDGTLISDIHQRLIENLKLSPNTFIFYGIVEKGRLTNRLNLTSTCSSALSAGELYAYEYQPIQIAPENKPDDIQTYFLEVGFSYVSSGVWSNRKIGLTMPLIFPIPLHATITEVRLQIFARIQEFIKGGKKNATLDEIKAFYKTCFPGPNSNVIIPYNLEIVNNRGKTARLILSAKYEECEFCDGSTHAEDCSFIFKDEDKLTFKEIIGKLKGKRDLVLNLVFNNKSTAVDLEELKKFFEFAKNVGKVDAGKTSKISIYDCLECFSTEEQLDANNKWYCPNCKEFVQAQKKMDLYKLPTILIIHLKRFKNKAQTIWGSTAKIDDYIDYQMTGLDLRKYTRASPEIAGGGIYDLFAVSNHFGGLSGGHYTATCYNPVVNKWLYFNDSSVYATGEEDVCSSAGYVLFYRRVDTTNGA